MTGAQKPMTVTRSVPTQDGQYLVLTSDGQSGSSPLPLPAGKRVRIENGTARLVAG